MKLRTKVRLSSAAAPVKELAAYYHALFAAHGPQGWWPGGTRFEVIVGAILVQNTSWRNVERAIKALRREKLLSFTGIENVSLARLERLIRSSGYFRQKARKLKEFVRFVREEHGGSLDRLFAVPTAELREQLLAVHGIGRETADSILLYAGGHKVFVVDTYTRRVLERHGLADAKAPYEEIRAMFERALPADEVVFNEYHALIVHTGKNSCRKGEADCGNCALGAFLQGAAVSTRREIFRSGEPAQRDGVEIVDAAAEPSLGGVMAERKREQSCRTPRSVTI
jgi:endonuclease III related protein